MPVVHRVGLREVLAPAMAILPAVGIEELRVEETDGPLVGDDQREEARPVASGELTPMPTFGSASRTAASNSGWPGTAPKIAVPTLSGPSQAAKARAASSSGSIGRRHSTSVSI